MLMASPFKNGLKWTRSGGLKSVRAKPARVAGWSVDHPMNVPGREGERERERERESSGSGVGG